MAYSPYRHLGRSLACGSVMQRYASIISSIFTATGPGRKEDSEKSTESIPERNAKHDSQRLCQREGREEEGEARLSEDHPEGTKLTSSACKENSELELQGLAQAGKDSISLEIRRPESKTEVNSKNRWRLP